MPQSIIGSPVSPQTLCLAVKRLLDEMVISRWQLIWNECGKGWVTYEYVEAVSARESFVVDFGLEMGVLLTGHGSLNEFLFLPNLVFSQSCVLCGTDSEGWFHVQCVCSAYCDNRNLENKTLYLQLEPVPC